MQPLIGIIDDDNDVRFSVSILFEVSGFDVEMFGSSEEFLACQDFSRFACLIVDFRLPGLSGLDLLRILREQRVLTPAIVSSGFITESEEADFIAAGALKVLHKTVEAKLLVSTVSDVVARSDNLQDPPYSEAG
ncbi:MAG: response regulator transcription factor [Planctomycetales bacterium]|jgi:two-component system response regulator FixJ